MFTKNTGFLQNKTRFNLGYFKNNENALNEPSRSKSAVTLTLTFTFIASRKVWYVFIQVSINTRASPTTRDILVARSTEQEK